MIFHKLSVIFFGFTNKNLTIYFYYIFFYLFSVRNLLIVVVKQFS